MCKDHQCVVDVDQLDVRVPHVGQHVGGVELAGNGGDVVGVPETGNS